jgi:hypothetical protein
MDKFRERVIKRKKLLSIFILFVCGFILFDVFFMDNLHHTEGFIYSFQFGLMIGLELLAILKVIKIDKAVKDDKKLKLLYNKENDERLKYIRSRAGMPLIMVNSIIMIMAGIVAGYFNSIIFFTLITTAIFQLFIGAIIKMYFLRKI